MNLSDRPEAVRTVGRVPAHYARLVLLTLALFFGGASVGAYAPAIFATNEASVAHAQDEQSTGEGTASPSAQAATASCDVTIRRVDAEPWARSELFFGTAKSDGSAVTDAEWRGFLDKEITARFPDGLTVMTGVGQYRGEDDQIIQERSMIVILLYPREAARDSGAKIEQIRDAYERQFQQSSVLRADDSLPVCTSF
jgi:hypothetical protein